MCQAHLGVLKFCEAVFELPSAEQIQLMMASNDMVSTVMYWIIWDLADCDLDEEVSVGFIPPVDLERIPRIPVKGAAETIYRVI